MKPALICLRVVLPDDAFVSGFHPQLSSGLHTGTVEAYKILYHSRGFFKDNVTGGDVRLKRQVGSQGTLHGPHSPLVTMQYVILLNMERNKAPHGREMSARPNRKVRQWRRPRKSHDSDMLLTRSGPYTLVGTSSYKSAGWWGNSSPLCIW